MKKFSSKIDNWVSVFLWLMISMPFWFFLANFYTQINLNYLQLLLLPIAAVLIWVRFRIVYIIDGEVLTYQSGPIQGQLKIKDIYKIHRTTEDPFNSSNLSADKISIRVRKRSALNISPLEKDEFIEALRAVNPAIEID